jgi:hypothetical protein
MHEWESVFNACSPPKVRTADYFRPAYWRRYSPLFMEVEYQKLAVGWYLIPDIKVATVNLHNARSCLIDASKERRERKVCMVWRKASGVEAWQRRAV